MGLVKVGTGAVKMCLMIVIVGPEAVKMCLWLVIGDSRLLVGISFALGLS